MKALESFEIHLWNALWVSKCKNCIHRQQIGMHFNRTLQKLKKLRFNTSITTFLFLKTYIFGGKFLFFLHSNIWLNSLSCRKHGPKSTQKQIFTQYLQSSYFIIFTFIILYNIYSHHAQDSKNFREFSLKSIKTDFRSTLV